jgi:ubiquinone/menaquinone biosynthesis C-methylase UbiE
LQRWVNANQDAHWDKRRFYRRPDDAAAEAFARPKIDWLCQALDIDGDARLLDVGAGTGLFTWWWARRVREVVGLELSTNMIERSPCADLIQHGDAYDLPFDDDSFDAVFCGNLLHHLERPHDALREMARVSRSPIALCEPNRNHPPMAAFGALSSVCRGLLHYSRRSFRELAEQADLEVSAVRLHGYIYENRSPKASIPIARRLEASLPGGAYILLAARGGLTAPAT